MQRFVDDAWTDVRQAMRRIFRSPGTSTVVILTLALAIAANTAIYSLLNATVLRKLPAPDPDALVNIGAVDARNNGYSSIHLESLRALQSTSRAFATLGAFSSWISRVEFDGLAFDTWSEGVSTEYFDVFRIRAIEGRLFAREDDPDAAVAVITRRLAVRLFGDQPATGRGIVVDGRQVEIIGVLPDPFAGVRMDGGNDVFLPIAFMRTIVQGSDPKGVSRAQALVGRLAPGVSLSVARSDVLGRWPSIQTAVAPVLPPAQRVSIENQRLNVDAFAHGMSNTRNRFGGSLGMVMTLAVALLAVGCVNLSGLMLARGLVRQHEFAVRIALGVSRIRLAQQVLIDGLLLSAMAMAVAMPLAWWASAVLTSMVSLSSVVPLGKTTPDLSIVLLAAGASLATGLVIGVLPARRAMSSSMDDVLRSRGVAHRLRGTSRAVLVTQIAASMILVVGAGLFGRTLFNLYANDVTPRAHEVVFSRSQRNPLLRGTPLPDGYYQALQRRLQESPGVDRAAFSVMFPGSMSVFAGRATDSVIARNGTTVQAIPDSISPSLFEVYAIPLLRGRDFSWSDAGASVAIVNETLARQLAGSLDVVGSRVEIAPAAIGAAKKDVEIIGVVADTTVTSIRQRQVAGIYQLLTPTQLGEGPMNHVRVVGDVATARRGFVDAINSQQQQFVRSVFTMSQWVDNAVVEQRLLAGIAGAAAALAVALASIGLFAMLAYSVSSRVREIGIRVSIGASRDEIVRMIVREGLAVLLPGLAAGVVLSLAAARVVQSQLYGVGAADPVTIAGAIIIFTITAVFASWLPARRAARIEPVEALRQD